jgi:hypothetical protein
MKRAIVLLLAVAVLPCGAARAAQEGVRITMEGTAVIGDKELPKVLYIVPWKDVKPRDGTEPLVSTPQDRSLSPVQRDEFRRKLKYQDDMTGH